MNITSDDLLSAAALLLCLSMFLGFLGVVRWLWRLAKKVLEVINSFLK